jgi:hypothetical protein
MREAPGDGASRLIAERLRGSGDGVAAQLAPTIRLHRSNANRHLVYYPLCLGIGPKVCRAISRDWGAAPGVHPAKARLYCGRREAPAAVARRTR